MESNGGNHAKDPRSDSDSAAAKRRHSSASAAPATTTTNAASTTAQQSNENATAPTVQKSPRKRRKVNHACVYCRRSHMTCDLERPCTRCIKRNIGHLCHDEPRDPDAKKRKSSVGPNSHDEADPPPPRDLARNSIDQSAVVMPPPPFDASGAGQGNKQGFGSGALGQQRNPLQLVPPSPVSGMQANASGTNINFSDFSNTWLSVQGQFHDMHNYSSQNQLPVEVTGEFNLINDFLNTSALLDDSGQPPDDPNVLYQRNQGYPADMANVTGAGNGNNGLLAPDTAQAPNAEHGLAIARPTSTAPADKDKAREFWLQAADPSGDDTPEARMQRVMKAKHEAGMLKPFNYIKGYARLGNYMDDHIAPISKQKILRQLDRFRPKFREKAAGLTDMELIVVEMWFERTLMEYDRVFAAMAVPACCWRRTGEIVRGNKEMAELIHVPVENLRDAKISLHEILTEDSLVRYWEEFGTIAFDPAHDTLLTACTLKTPDDASKDPFVHCCFSFMIRRDDHKIPGLIVGNFLPQNPVSN